MTRDLDKVLAALRSGPRSLGCLVPATLAIGAAALPVIGVFLSLAPVGREASTGAQEARQAVRGQLPPKWCGSAVYAPLTAVYGAIVRRPVPRA